MISAGLFSIRSRVEWEYFLVFTDFSSFFVIRCKLKLLVTFSYSFLCFLNTKHVKVFIPVFDFSFLSFPNTIQIGASLPAFETLYTVRIKNFYPFPPHRRSLPEFPWTSTKCRWCGRTVDAGSTCTGPPPPSTSWRRAKWWPWRWRRGHSSRWAPTPSTPSPPSWCSGMTWCSDGGGSEGGGGEREEEEKDGKKWEKDKGREMRYGRERNRKR